MLPRGFPRQLNGGKPARPPRDRGSVLPHRARVAFGPVEPGFFLRRSISPCRLFRQALGRHQTPGKSHEIKCARRGSKQKKEQPRADRSDGLHGIKRPERSCHPFLHRCSILPGAAQKPDRGIGNFPLFSTYPGQRLGSGKSTSRHSAQAGPGAQSQRKQGIQDLLQEGPVGDRPDDSSHSAPHLPLAPLMAIWTSRLIAASFQP